jgi:hypothetical protein
MKRLYVYALALLLVVLLLGLVIEFYITNHTATASPNVNVGIDAAFSGVPNVEELVNEVKSYTNFFVIGSTVITYNMSELNQICQYLNDSGLYFAPFMHINPEAFNQTRWVIQAQQTWGSYFWGLFPYDEAGGAQIDKARSSVENGNISLMIVQEAANYTDAADKFVSNLSGDLAPFKFNDVPLMTSDYALYEFDYRAGYNVVLAELGYNLSKPLQVALCRGAATMRNDDWGVIITWTYGQPPYLENKSQLYDDMVYAYQSGAKYILVFDSNLNYTQNVLQQGQLDAVKQFWNYIKANPREENNVQDRVAFVIPANYGYGFRGPNDTIWGLWSADSLSANIWNNVTSLVKQYKINIDVIYEDDLQFSISNYSKLIFWNGTVIQKIISH